ncbi:hypothetical protein [Clostridium sp. OF09-36]|uniref:hypothetical protein n=1 Tax=Clostridium sp. OF09-36 TaxID=2292310 RepID=UPI0015FAE294|nr:hypothetical protein [Clostridium sp. OF09-36]
MMILSLAACTPTTEKNKTGEVKEPETEAVETTADAGPGVVTGRPVDQDAPDLTMVSVYSVSEDGSKIEGTMDSVETLDAQSLTDLLIQYGVLDDGTKQSALLPKKVLPVRKQDRVSVQILLWQKKQPWS